MTKKQTWQPMELAPTESYERWQSPDRLILLCDGQPTIGYLERQRSGKTRWRTITGNIVEPKGWLPMPEIEEKR